MAELTPQVAAEVVAACQAGAEEVAGALARTLGGHFQFAVSEATKFDASNMPDGFDGPGLIASFTFGNMAAVAVLPASSGRVPDWCAAPDAAGASKLSTLAQELSMLLLPDSLPAEEYACQRVGNLAAAIRAAKPAGDAACVPLTIAGGDKQGTLSLVWPLQNPAGLASSIQQGSPKAKPSPLPTSPPGRATVNFTGLPAYTRSLLKIEVPVAVTLAAKKESMGEILELATGSIIKFQKTCDQLLDLTVGEQPIAKGEVVKVGDKFGLKIHAMHLPQEHFVSVPGDQ